MKPPPPWLTPAPPHTLRDYSFLADGERGILVGPRGDFAWLCFPRWDSEAVFSALIGGRGGYAITPIERHVWGGFYEPGSLIWHSRWVTDDSCIIECREALALPGQGDRAVVLRRVSALAGPAKVRVLLDVSAGYGQEPMRRVKLDEAGLWHGQSGHTHFSWSGGEQARTRADGRRGHALELEFTVPEGRHHDFVLTLSTDANTGASINPQTAWDATEAGWAERVPSFQRTVAERDARHAYAVLDGLSSSSGGMVAAATTSLPERVKEARNYDYRYAWIRDQCYAGQAVACDGPHALMDAAVRFVGERLLQDGSQLKPAYTVNGKPIPREHRLRLPGYPGGCDIAGNWVNDQFQLDAFGEALLLFAAAAAHDHLDNDGWQAAEIAAKAIGERWQEPDAGIWELDPAAWTHSRLTCAAGLRSISRHGPGGEQAASWLALADRLVADSGAHAVHPSGRWQRAPQDPRVDASLLLAAIRGAVPGDDPRTIATLRAVEQELTQDGYCYRFRHDDRPLAEAEGAFLLCGFLMALAYTQQGEHVTAARWFERNRSAVGPPGLCSEEFDVVQRQLRGNLPQAFVHALLLECAVEQRGSSGAD